MTEPRFPGNDRERSPLDQVTAERLLDGRLDRRTVPPDYAVVLDLLDAARAPAAPTELAGEGAALASFRARHRHPTRRPRVLSKLLTVKAAVVAVSALSVAGAAAAATGSLPGTGARPTLGAAAHSTAGAGSAAADGSTAEMDRTGRIALCEAVARRGGAAEAAPAAAALARLAGGPAAVEAYCAQAGSTTKPDTTAGRGPDATGAARAGLCRAVADGRGGELGGKESAAAFEALALAAGGADKVEAYCADPVSSAAAGGKPSTRPSAAPTATPSHPGPPESTRGGRPTAPPAAVPSPSRQSGRP